MDKFTEEDIYACWPVWHMEYFLQILNGEYELEAAREDLNSLIDSKYDARSNHAK